MEHLGAIVDGQVAPGPDEPTVVLGVDEFEPVYLMPSPGRMWPGSVGRRPTRNGERGANGGRHAPGRRECGL